MRSDKRAAWYALLDGYTSLIRVMDDDLQRECGVPLLWYDVMIKLWHAPGHAMRMNLLAEQVLLSRSWLTRRIAQLERAGLVERRPADDDGRGVVAAMTERGRSCFRDWERSHSRSIARHFSATLSAEDAAVLQRVGTALARSARARLVAPAPARP